MPTYLLTVQSAELMSLGLRVSPGLRPSEATGRPAIAKLTQGSMLELRHPSGSTLRTPLATFGVSADKADDGSLYMHDDPKDPEIKLILSPSLGVDDVPPGTEVWFLGEMVANRP